MRRVLDIFPSKLVPDNLLWKECVFSLDERGQLYTCTVCGRDGGKEDNLSVCPDFFTGPDLLLAIYGVSLNCQILSLGFVTIKVGNGNLKQICCKILSDCHKISSASNLGNI